MAHLAPGSSGAAFQGVHTFYNAGAEAARLQETLAPLEPLGFPVDTWSVPALLALPLTPKLFITSVKIVTTITDDAVRQAVLSLGITHNYWTQNSNCTIQSMLRFCKFLRTEAGLRARNDVTTRVKLQRKGDDQRTMNQSALLSAFQVFSSDYAQEKNAIRFEAEKRIAALQRQLQQERSRLDEDMNELALEFSPVSIFTDYDEVEFMQRVWEKYEAHCRAQNLAAPPRTPELLERVKTVYRQAVREEKILGFLANPEVANGVREYMEEKIILLANMGDTKRAETFRRLMEAAGNGVAAAAPASAPAQAVPTEEYTGRPRSIRRKQPTVPATTRVLRKYDV